jgi:hypothetical protein
MVWQKEIDDKQAALDKMYKEYDAEKVMLSDTLQKKRETSCSMEKEVGICNANALVMKEIYSNCGRNW